MEKEAFNFSEIFARGGNNNKRVEEDTCVLNNTMASFNRKQLSAYKYATYGTFNDKLFIRFSNEKPAGKYSQIVFKRNTANIRLNGIGLKLENKANIEKKIYAVPKQTSCFVLFLSEKDEEEWKKELAKIKNTKKTTKKTTKKNK